MEFFFEVFAAMQSMCGSVLSLRKGQTEILPCPLNATVSLRTPMTIKQALFPKSTLLLFIGNLKSTL